MPKQRTKTLPEEILEPLREMAKYAGNEKLFNKDPLKFLSAMLNSMQFEMGFGNYNRAIGYILHVHCSPDGVSALPELLQKDKVA